MKVYIATIMHEYGSTGFAAKSEEERLAKVAAWCRENDVRQIQDRPNTENDQETVDDYFAFREDELCFLDEDELV